MTSAYEKMEDELMKVIIFGPPSSGKGTYARIISEELEIVHVSTGILIREEQNKGTELGKRLKEVTKRGRDLLDDKTMTEMLKKRIYQEDCQKKGFILDGYPRNLNQAKLLEGITPIDFIISLNVSDEIIIERTINRRECKKCHASYNLIFHKPKKSGICDECGSELYQRPEDTREAAEYRLSVFRKDTIPAIDSYRGKIPFVDFTPENPYAHPKVNAGKIIAKLKERGFIKHD